ncbi:MAG TPA: response regulator [Tepidisphaeraceae bacterium]|jgi:putative two-component system response regulator|nr:response regulator [Tepidisphaeraceae bacterium]
MKVLIVDDDRLTLTVLRNMLASRGHEVTTASNGQDAIEILRHGGHRLVLSDWEMPDMDGLDLCRAIRAEKHIGYTYVILLTSHREADEKVKGLLAGADDFIAKPFNPAELLARVQIGERLLSLETRDAALFALAKLAESRDPETGSHLERVQSYCREIAERIADTGRCGGHVTPEYVHLIYLTSPLHDVGKVGIPDHVLLKPGRLNPSEFEVMKTHTTIGARTLSAALEQFPGIEYLQMAWAIAATHHEKFDGTGYPNGLKGDSIPLCGRIVAVADVYDALTSRRVYKPSYDHDVARTMIVADSGVSFDPDVVEAFLEIQGKFSSIRKEFENELAMAA